MLKINLLVIQYTVPDPEFIEGLDGFSFYNIALDLQPRSLTLFSLSFREGGPAENFYRHLW